MSLEFHGRLPLSESSASPLRSAVGTPAPPLSRVIRAGLLGAFLCQVLLLSVAGMRNRYVLESDALSYIRLAWYYATGQFHLAVVGYWGPLLSWLMVPWIGWTAQLVDAARIAMGLSAVVFVGGCVAIFRSLALPPVALLGGTWLAALASIFWSVEYITPDLLMSGIFGLALSQMLHVRWCTSRRTPWLAGMLCGLAYLAKSIALPATVTCTLGVGFLWVYSYRWPWRQVGRSVGLTFLGCALVAGPWIALLSWKYRTFTFTTSGRIGHAIVGPPDVPRRHPFRRMFHQPEAGRILSWEKPSTMPYNYWSPLESRAYAKHQLFLIYKNTRHLLKTLRRFDALGIGLLALGGGICLLKSRRQRLQAERWHWAIVPVIGLAGWYLPVHALDQRYYFLAYPFMLAASTGLVLSLTSRLHRWQQGARCVGLLLVVSVFAYPLLTRLPVALRGREAPSIMAHALAMKLQAADVRGPLAGVGGKEGHYIAFFIDQPWYGEEQHPTLERLKAARAALYVIPRQAALLTQLDADPAFRNLDPLLFASTEEAQRYPWRVYQMSAP